MSNEIRQEIKDAALYIKEQTKTISHNFLLDENKVPSIFDSKIGGLPYWDIKNTNIPKDSNGSIMALLAQINLNEIKDDRLPHKGILQFFISSTDGTFGLDFDDNTSQKNYRILYHENIDDNVAKEQIQTLGFYEQYTGFTKDGKEIMLPMNCEIALTVKDNIDYMTPNDYRFDRLFQNAIQKITGKFFTDSLYDFCTDEEQSYLFNELNANGHKILGHPTFIQHDVRNYMSEEKANYYDTLLFQLDSETFSNGEILWGDCGIANFFINSKSLKDKDFTNILYNWDCC